MRRLAGLFVVLALLGAACGDDDDDDDAGGSTSTTTTTTTTEATTTTPSTATSTTVFDGSTDPREGAAAAPGSTLLTDVAVTAGSVTFTFREGTPGYRIAYTDEPITQDGSGEPVAVEGDAHLTVRFEPASGYDMSAGAESYTGPDRIPGDDPVTEVVRTGDFEAVLNWVIGVTSERPYRVETTANAVTIVIG